MRRHLWRLAFVVLLLVGGTPMAPAAAAPAAPGAPVLVCDSVTATAKPQTCAVAEVLHGLAVVLRAAGIDVPILSTIDQLIAEANSGVFETTQIPLASGGTVACADLSTPGLCARVGQYVTLMRATVRAAAIADATLAAIENLPPEDLALICGLNPALSVCEGSDDPYALLEAAATLWFTSQPAAFGSEASHGVGRPPSTWSPDGEPSLLTMILDPSLITGTVGSPQRLIGSFDSVLQGQFACTVPAGCTRAYWVNVWRTATQLCSQTGHVSAEVATVSGSGIGCMNWVPGDGYVAGYQYWGPLPGNTAPSFGTYFTRGSGSGQSFASEVGPSSAITPTRDYSRSVGIFNYANVSAAIKYHRIYEGSAVGQLNGATGYRAWLQNYQPAWGIPGTDGSFEFDYPFLDPREDDPPHRPAPSITPTTPPTVPASPTTTIVPPAPTIPEYAPTEDPGSDTTLATRIGGMFSGLFGVIQGGFSWLLDGITNLLRWLVDRLWEMFRWLADQLAAWIADLIAAVESIWDLLGFLITVVSNGFGVLGQLVVSAVLLVRDAVLWVGAQISALISLTASMLQAVIDAVLSVPQMILDGLEALFVPTDLAWDLPPCGEWFPCSWVEEAGAGMATISGLLDSPGGCTAPAIGWSEFLVSFPPPPGCSAASGSVALGAGSSTAGDLFGYRTALRAASLVAFMLWFVSFVISLTPWATRRQLEMSPDQQTAF